MIGKKKKNETQFLNSVLSVSTKFRTRYLWYICVLVVEAKKELTFSPLGPRGPASPGRPERPFGPSGPSSPLGPADPSSPWKTQKAQKKKIHMPYI